MTYDAIVQLINTVGFPIACVIAMFWMWNKEREAHSKESEKFCEAIDNNTTALKELIQTIQKG